MEVTYFWAYCLKFVVMLAILSTAGTTPLCPSGCGCTGGAPETILTVNCHRNPDVDNGQLSEQIDSVLSSNLSCGHLTWLSIANTPLTHVPRSVCRLTTLTQLHLDHNRLTRLPDSCLCNLTALTTFTASNNRITELQDGLFDGLDKLVTLDLTVNLISSIGLSVFNSSASLTSLRAVYLNDNRIHTLEPWFYYVGINGQLGQQSRVELDHNNISVFTNNMDWKAKCGMKPMYVYLRLSHNPIKHISDIINGWNTSFITWWCLSRHSTAEGSVVSSQFDLSHIAIECDCVDYKYIKLLQVPVRNRLLGNIYCDGPAAVYGKRIVSVPLHKLVCELTERCPPGCRCVHRPANATLHIYCSNANLSFLPLELPELPKSYTRYKLDFSNNRLLRRLERRNYFASTYFLDVTNCNIESIDFELWNELMANITYIFLGGNRLQSLPSAVATVSLQRANVTLGRNPWRCSCDASWMPNWLKSVKSRLVNPNDITCSSPTRLKDRNIMSIDGEAFCIDPAREAVQRAMTISMSTVFGVLIALLSVGVVVYRLRVKMYSRWKFHPFDRDECLGENLDYDVFLSCSSNNNLPHGNRIREQLEQRGYRVCYPPRDFVAGETIHDNIYSAVVRSKRTVCFLTSQFLHRFVLMYSFVLILHNVFFRLSICNISRLVRHVVSQSVSQSINQSTIITITTV